MGRIGCIPPPLFIKLIGKASAAALPCLAALVLFSCSNGLLKDPRLYNAKKPSGMYVAPEPELGLTGGVDPFDNTEEWYNKPDTNGDETKPDANGFDASEFDSIQIAGEFDGSNVPTYTMTKNKVWSPGDSSKGEYVHRSAPDTTGQGWKISSVTYYQYRGINPSYAANGGYNTQLQQTAEGKPKLSRFYFYRFTGYGGGVQWLDNNLMAVDTYSKLVFAFSEPVQFSTMGAPTKWDPTDNEKFNGISYQFYMYDPVGYVLKKGDTYEIKLYQWFQDSLAKGNYKANINTEYKDIAQKKEDKPGKSPFNNQAADFFKSNMKLLGELGTPFYRRETTADGGNGLVLYKYTVSEDGKTITRTAESWNGLHTETNMAEKTYSVGDGKSATKGEVTGDGVTELELADESRTLRFSNDDVARSNFLDSDPGPDWLLRVQGRSFETPDKKYKYEFSSDGRSVKYYKNGSEQETWTFYGTEDGNNAKAAYTGSGLVFKYWGFNLRGADDLYCTTGQGSTIYETLNMRTWADPAYVIRTKQDTFSGSVQEMRFGLRKKDADGLFGLDVEWYEFDATGSTVTLTTDTYLGNKTSQTYQVSSNSADSASFNGKTATLNTTGAHWSLTINGEEYVANYQDPGPSFIYRVMGKTYKGSGVTYEFTDDGKTLVYNGTRYTYDSGSDTFNSDGEIQAKYGGYWYTLSKSGEEISYWRSYAQPKLYVATLVRNK